MALESATPTSLCALSSGAFTSTSVLRLADTSRCAAATQLYRETERGKVGRNAAFDAAAEERYWQKG